jgi:hypothetical protein
MDGTSEAGAPSDARPVNRRARELLFSGSRRDGVQQIRFFSYRLVPGALPGMTGEPGSVGRRKIGPVALSGKFMLLIVSIILLNLKNGKLYNTPRRISAWRAVAGPPVPRPGPQNGHGHLTGLPGSISAARRTALPVAGRRWLTMKKSITYNEGEIVLDTDRDACIYYAPRGEPGGAYVRGKDLYLHEEDGVPDVYYLHSWSMEPGEDELLQTVSIVSAEEFLELRGLVLAAYPEKAGSLALRSYGYGIAEEF